jgi:hypothetical protein
MGVPPAAEGAADLNVFEAVRRLVDGVLGEPFASERPPAEYD